MISVVRAIDVGYGMTKYVLQSEGTGKFTCGSFPSLVTLGTGRQLGAGYFDERDTVLVQWQGQSYEVGADVSLALRGHNTRVLDASYIRSDDYQILIRGVLKKMGLSRLDLLVLGAPLLNFDQVSSARQAAVTGTIHPGAREPVVICRAVVPAPPGGGLAGAG